MVWWWAYVLHSHGPWSVDDVLVYCNVVLSIFACFFIDSLLWPTMMHTSSARIPSVPPTLIRAPGLKWPWWILLLAENSARKYLFCRRFFVSSRSHDFSGVLGLFCCRYEVHNAVLIVSDRVSLLQQPYQHLNNMRLVRSFVLWHHRTFGTFRCLIT